MAKRVIWSKRAKEERKEILEYWVERTGDEERGTKNEDQGRRRGPDTKF